MKYGKRFVESWLEFWPKSIGLTVFYEGEDSDFEMLSGISWRPYEEVEFLVDYLSNLRFPIQRGIVGDRYDINFDAQQGRKTFIEVHSLKTYGGKVFWIDADCETHKHVPETFLDTCLPDNKLCCYLGRDGWYYTESGFIGFNADHPLAKQFLSDYRKVFIVGSIFTQAPTFNEKRQLTSGGWHDCVAFDVIRMMATRDGHGAEFVNLAANVPHGHMHPFQISAPGEYLNHYKGARKETRQLKAEDVARG